MGWFSSKKEEGSEKGSRPESSVEWKNLVDMDQLEEIVNDKSGEMHVLFKHSTRCVVSTMAKREMEKEWPADRQEINVWYLDLLNHRDISNAIAEKTGVYHQSPQAIALVNGQVVYQATHGEISARRIIKSLEP